MAKKIKNTIEKPIAVAPQTTIDSIYTDSEGVEILAHQLSGATILNTIDGEKCGELSEWVIKLPTGHIKILTNELFTNSFYPKL